MLTVNIPLTIQEPIEILNYPVTLNLYPGETIDFNITIQNHASVNYALFLDFCLDNTTYQQSYVTTSNMTCSVHPGVQILSQWLKVSANATPLTTMLTVSFRREDFFLPSARVILYKANVNFTTDGAKRIDVDIGNSGTSDTIIAQLYVGTSSSSLQNQTITPITLPAGGLRRITINYDWADGSTYYFKVLTSSGQSLDWPEQTPMQTEQLSITHVDFDMNSGVIMIIANATGTSTVTINEVWVNSVKQVMTNPILPTDISTNTGLALNVTITGGLQAGNIYQIKLVSSRGYQYSYTAVAPTN